MSRTLKAKRLILWLWWLLVTTVGGAVIGALSAPTDFFWYVFMTGFVVGIAQWLVLRFYIRYAGWWVLASALGWFLGIFVTSIADAIFDPILQRLSKIALWEVFWLNTLTNPVTFATLGLVQWLVLRHHTRRAGWWVLANVIGGAVNGAVASTVCALVCDRLGIRGGFNMSTALSYGVLWAGNAAVTGIVLAWLLIHETKTKG